MSSALFPENCYEFLASLWLQQQDLSNKSPVEIADLYFKAYQDIYAKYCPPSKPKSQHRGVVHPGLDFES